MASAKKNASKKKVNAKSGRKAPLSSKEIKIRSFDPNGPALSSANIFGLPFTSGESEIVLLPVPWEVTVSYGGGTARGPKAIFDASSQVDLFHPEFPDLWKVGIAMEPVNKELFRNSKHFRKKASALIDDLSSGRLNQADQAFRTGTEEVNAASASMIDFVYEHTRSFLLKGKLVGLIGGDHSTPLGFMKALGDIHGSYGVLQIDAHMDLRRAYEGFTYSHASIMYNALKLKQVKKLVQVGIRDYCQEEHECAMNNSSRVKVFTYASLQQKKFEGLNWKMQCRDIIACLPDKVYISFDIDGLDPSLCPNTGTPVPGGFSFHEVTYLLSSLVDSGKKIIGFDLNEVSPGKDDWDGNVGARMLFHLCGVLAAGSKRISMERQ